MRTPEDQTVAAYIRRRNEIARHFGTKLVKHANWATADHVVSSDPRSDPGGLVILGKFERKLKKLGGAPFYADCGEGIAIWIKNPLDADKEYCRKVRQRIEKIALFHPGYLPVRNVPKGWHHLRVENPNPSPYYHINIEWMWTIYFDPTKIKCKFKRFDVNVPTGLTNGQRVLIAVDKTHYDLPSPYVTSQKRMDEILADLTEFRRKVKLAEERTNERASEIAAAVSEHGSWEGAAKFRKAIWFNLEEK